LAFGLAGCGRVQPDPAAAIARQNASSTLPPIPTSSTSTSTTIDPGSLPQTADLPSPSSAAFNARMQALWQAIVDGTPGEALVSFFPRSAYLQVKAVANPGADWQTRLVNNFDQDIAALHQTLGQAASGATLLGVDVPSSAVWVHPGAEFNRLSYWRVYGTQVRYEVDGAVRHLVIASMISWRGEWYVVHLASIR
jgi:hypothetical protein